MAEYREIFGEAIQSLASNSTTIEGQIWYDTANNVFRLQKAALTAAWSRGANLPGIRWNTSGAGTQTAGLIFGGATGPATSAFLNTTFEYDGSTWTSSGDTPIS